MYLTVTVCDEQTVLRTPRHGLAGDRHVDPYVAVTARQDCLRVGTAPDTFI